MDIKKKNKILDLLKSHKEGLTVAQISRELKIHRNTVTVYVRELIGEKEVIERDVGKAKLLYYFKYTPF